jgi:pseudouridine synthase
VVRLNKFIASSGFAARRKADELIKDGRVSVNSCVVTELGTKIDPQKDAVRIDGELVKQKSDFTYILLNKPRGYITSASDEKNRPVVLELTRIKKRVFPVGRLDFNSEGLLLLTDDGELAHRLMHPSSLVYKTYMVKLSGAIDDKRLRLLREGVKISGRKTASAFVSVVPNSAKKEIKISIHEGRNRQIRKMLESVGLFVRRLRRTEYANLKDDSLKPGQWRYLTKTEVSELKSVLGRNPKIKMTMQNAKYFQPRISTIDTD